MGKKAKVGKSRKDKFYQLAKETGYRARSAFKLIQLNRKYEFLQKSQVVIDLCAAPGGWLQVVAENTPVSSIIVGVDLVKIKPLPNVVTLQEDITTDKCRQALRKELQTWKADCVIHDGAPNVGQNWIQDAFKQSELTLVSLKLATEFLKSGGWFVTKVFRSRDYNSLLWVFRQLFKHVYATKPQASRNESAEIFVICQGYLAPNRVDPKFLDAKHVFKEVEPEPKRVIDLMHPAKQRRHRDGYVEGDYTQYHELSATDFIQKDNHMELLAATSAIILDDDKIANHPLTTTEIKECLNDIKVLGKKELQNLMKWRTQLNKFLEQKEEDNSEDKETTEILNSDEDDELKLDEKLAELKEEDRKNLKKKLKKVRREKIKLRHKMDMQMILPDDKPDLVDDFGLFNLTRIKNKKQLEEMEMGTMSEVQEEDIETENHPNVTVYDRDTRDYLDPNEGSLSEDSGEEEPEFEDETDDDGNYEERYSSDAESEEGNRINPLLVSLEDKNSKKKKNQSMWYSKDSFAGLEDEKDEYMEIQQMVDVNKKKSGNTEDNKKKNITKSKAGSGNATRSKSEVERDKDSGTFSGSDNIEESDTGSESNSDFDERDLPQPAQLSGSAGNKKELKTKNKKGGFEVVPESRPDLKLNPVGLALGAAMVSSRKRRREIIEDAYHRFTFDDDNLPDWFRKDEVKHSKKQLPVTKGDVEEYRMQLKAIDAQPIKKVAEAKARRKKKSLKKLERVRKKAEAISDTVDISEKEKWLQIKQMYKKAGLLSKKKKEVEYIVAKKGIGKRVRRPHGVQGPFKVVDPRMKKDTRKMKAMAKSQKKGRKGKKVDMGKKKKR